MLTFENAMPEHLQPLAEAGALFDAQEYLPAMAQFEQLAARGSATASSMVAWMHRTGAGVPVSVELAQQWYEYASKQGSHMAMSSGVALSRARRQA
ncbi:MAG TPA: hypothetical protein VM555_08800 [Tahibacter sp.]|nr:hypothetical protein [Tahibacter sp.]